MKNSEFTPEYKYGRLKALGKEFIIYNSKDIAVGKIELVEKTKKYKYSFFDAMICHIDCINDLKRIVKELNTKKVDKKDDNRLWNV